ncbi:MAG: hypothetical protein V7636_330 [Actinomycetota bacterium]
MRWRILLAAVLAVALTSCGDDDDNGGSATVDAEIGGIAAIGGAEAWPAPPANEVDRVVQAAGLALGPSETLIHHVHAHLDVFIDGKHRTVPAGIGIVFTDPAVHKDTFAGGPTYGGIITPCAQPCISPLHTHDITGTLHTESATADDNTLGELFAEWDVKLTDSCVGTYCAPDTPIRVYVDGKAKPLASAADIELTNLREIAIVIGRPPARIPSEGDFSSG